MEDKIVQIRRLYEQVQKYPLSEDEKDQYEDDLPNFLLTLGERELGELLDSVSRNSVKKEDATCHMYTVHSYKGLEHDYVRVANDVEPSEENLYYVALTRGMKYIAY
jgi:superfamily I DNA/RNA helicase